MLPFSLVGSALAFLGHGGEGGLWEALELCIYMDHIDNNSHCSYNVVVLRDILRVKKILSLLGM